MKYCSNCFDLIPTYEFSDYRVYVLRYPKEETLRLFFCCGGIFRIKEETFNKLSKVFEFHKWVKTTIDNKELDFTCMFLKKENKRKFDEMLKEYKVFKYDKKCKYYFERQVIGNESV